MSMETFFARFPDIAAKETRTALIRGQRRLPDGDYGFIELYCNKPGCDCRRVFLEVVTEDSKMGILATINYGWESPEFYRRWMSGFISEKALEVLVGPSIPAFLPQSPLAPALLEVANESLLSDPQYVARLQRHYAMFRRSVGRARTRNRAKKRRRRRRKG